MKTKRLLFILVVLLSSQVLIAESYSHDLTPNISGWHMNVDLGMRQTMLQTMVVAGSPETGYKTYFSADDGSEEGLWCTDGVHPAWRVKNEWGDPKGQMIQRLTSLNDKVLFTCSNWLWYSNGTSGGTNIMITNGVSYANVQAIVQLNATQVVFIGQRFNDTSKELIDNVARIFVSDGTPGGTRIISESVTARHNYYENGLDVNASILRVGNKVYFEAWGGTNWDIWVTDGTAAGTYNVTNYGFSDHDPLHHNFVNYNNEALCYVVNYGTYWALAKTVNDAGWDPIWYDPAATADLLSFRNMQCYNGDIYFTAFGHLWRHDGSENHEVYASANWPDLIGQYKGNLMFVANDGDCHLFTCNSSNQVSKLSNFGVTFQDNGYAIVNDWFYTYGECVGRGWGIYRINEPSDIYPTQVTNQLAWHPINDKKGYKLIDNKGRLVYALNTVGAGNTKLYSYEYTDYAMTLTESDNSSTIANNAAKLVNATINRTMNTYSGYYTICLPFDMTDAQLTETFGSGYKLEAFTGTSVSGGFLNLNFTQVYELTHGTPYLIKPTKYVSNPTVPNCWVYNTNPVPVFQSVADGSGVWFHGTYNPVNCNANPDTPIRLLGENDKFYRPANSNALKSLRCWFEILAGEPALYVSIRHADNTATEIPLVEEQLTPRVQKIVKDNKVMILRNGKTYDIMGRIITK